MTSLKTNVTKDSANRKMTITRDFAAPRANVWAAYTQSNLLDQWWAPKPWKAVTKSMDFREGGRWHYYMAGPEGEKHWCFLDFTTIRAKDTFSGHDGFCDEQGNVNKEMPQMDIKNTFTDANGGTHVQVEVTFSTEEDMKKILEMGAAEGFSMALDNLEEVLAGR